MNDLPELRTSLIDDETIMFVARQLRGIRDAHVRFIGGNPAYEAEFLDLLLALGVSATSTHISDLAPPPARRVGMQFKGASAVVTVDPALPLHG